MNIFSILFVFEYSSAWQITFDCGPHGKNGADLSVLVVKSTEEKPRRLGRKLFQWFLDISGQD